MQAVGVRSPDPFPPYDATPSPQAHVCVVLQVIGDIVVGSVLGPSSQRANEARIASFFAGIPEEVPIRTVNRWVL